MLMNQRVTDTPTFGQNNSKFENNKKQYQPLLILKNSNNNIYEENSKNNVDLN